MNSKKLLLLSLALVLTAACRKQYAFDWESDDGPSDVSSDHSTDAQTDVVVDNPIAADRTQMDGSTIDLGVPRQIAPLSTSTVTSLHPTLHWVLAPGTDGARVQICRDRACNTEVTHFDVTGTYGAPSANLPSGVLYWRLYPSLRNQVGTNRSPTWEFTVGTLNATHDSSWGTTLDINGDGYGDVAVGAPNASRVFVFVGGAAGTSTSAPVILTAPDASDGGFGTSVSSAGDVNGDGFADLLVTAANAVSNTGRAFIYLGSASGVSTVAATTLTGPGGSGGFFGTAASSAGDINGDGFCDILIGSNRSGVGTGYVYVGSGNGIVASPATMLVSPDGSASSFSAAVAGAGDVNADGFADIIIAARGDMPGGAAYVYLGGSNGPSTQPDSTLVGPANGSDFGSSVATSGDVNGDGYSDVVVGAYGVGMGAGGAFVFLGGLHGTLTSPSTSLWGPDGSGGFFGAAVSGAGDINGDGYSDTIVGAYAVMTNTGRVYLYLGSVGGTSTIPSATLTGSDGQGGYFGFSISSADDVNGDGYSDIIVAAPRAMAASGHVFVFEGASTGMLTAPSFTLTSPDGATGSYFGSSVADNNPLKSVPMNRVRQHRNVSSG